MLAITTALLSASGVLAAVVEQWTFDGSNPQTGINGTIISTWTTNAPNSVPSAGVLRYADTTDSDWGDAQLLPDQVVQGNVDARATEGHPGGERGGHHPVHGGQGPGDKGGEDQEADDLERLADLVGQGREEPGEHKPQTQGNAKDQEYGGKDVHGVEAHPAQNGCGGRI